MARKKKDIDELDEELEQLEAELRALEAGEDPVPEATEPEAPDEEEEADQQPTGKKSRAGGLLGKLPFGGGKDDEDDGGDASDAPDASPDTPPEQAPVQQPEEGPEAPAAAEQGPAPEAEELEPPEEESSPLGALLGKLGRAKGGKEDQPTEEADAPAPTDAAEEDAAEAGHPATGPDHEPEDTEEGTSLSGLLGRFRRDKDEPEEDLEREAPPPSEPGAEQPPKPDPQQAPEPDPDPEARPELDPEVAAARSKARSDRWEPEEGGWRRRDPSDAPATEEAGEDEGRARALLARFRGPGDEGNEGEEEAVMATRSRRAAPEDEEEEEDEERSKPALWLWIILALLAVALLAAAGIVLLGGEDGGLGGAPAPTAAVASPNQATTAEGTPVAAVGQAFTLDATGSTGEIDEYRWAFGDGEEATTSEPTVEHTYAAAGTYEVTVTAVGEGGQGEATLEVLVVQAPVAQADLLVAGAPVAAPGEVGNNARLGQTVALDASGSSADDQLELVSFAWDTDGDGQPDATGEQAEVTFGDVGAWTVALTVTDDLGLTATAEQVVHVANVFQFNDTAAVALPEATTTEHPFSADEGRGGAVPIQISAVLTYSPPAQGINEDLDLVLIDPDGNEHEASEDDGDGEETITLSQGDLSALGDWTARVTHEQGGLQEIDYGLVIEVFY